MTRKRFDKSFKISIGRAQYEETIAGYKDGMAKFSALSDKLVYTSNTDPAVQVPSGYNEKSGIGLWGKGGKMKVSIC